MSSPYRAPTGYPEDWGLERCYRERRVIGDCTLYLGDCLQILPSLTGVDAIVTDPPYGIGFEYESYQDTRANLTALIIGVFANRAAWQRGAFLCGISQTHLYPEPDWTIATVWDTTGSFGKYGYTQWMPILMYGEDLKGFGNVNGVTKSDVIRFTGGAGVGFQRAEIINHPCPKPVNIMERVVNRITSKGSTVLDPFMGSGTTGVACVKLGRKFIGIEIEPKYFDIACKRIEDAYKQGDMFLERPAPPKQEPML